MSDSLYVQPASSYTLAPSLTTTTSRQDPVDKATSAMKPESEKSTLEKAGDSVKGTADNIAGTAQPGGPLPRLTSQNLLVRGD